MRFDLGDEAIPTNLLTIYPRTCATTSTVLKTTPQSGAMSEYVATVNGLRKAYMQKYVLNAATIAAAVAFQSGSVDRLGGVSVMRLVLRPKAEIKKDDPVRICLPRLSDWPGRHSFRELTRELLHDE